MIQTTNSEMVICDAGIGMSIIIRDKGERCRKALFSRSNRGSSSATVSIIIIALTLLTGGGFALTSPTTMTTAFAQGGNSTCYNTRGDNANN